MICLLCVLSVSRPVTLMAVGDVMLDRYVGRAIVRYGTAYPLARVKPVFAKADLVVGNLECPITSRPRVLEKHFVFRAAPTSAAALRGFDVLSVANNHSLDCGTAGLADTVLSLSKLGIMSAGSSLEPVILTRQGVRIAFLAFSDFPESVPSGLGQSFSWSIAYYDRSQMTASIASAHRRADVVVVIAHWGAEGESKPSTRQRKEAKELADAGADLILGAHPHMLQPVERIGKTVVAYSMGNFVFDAAKKAERKTAVFSFSIGKSGVDSWRLVPCTIQNGRPVPDK